MRSLKKSLIAVSFLSTATIGFSHAGSYSYTTGMLILDRVKVQTPTDNYYAQLSLKLSEQDSTFTGLGIVPLPDNFPSADATLTFDVSSNNYILTVLNASGYYGVLTSASINGPYTPSNVISVQANVVGAIGATGPKGDTGDTGPKGEKGDTGVAGPKGDKGDIGLTGLKGDKGDIGLTGLKGDKGDQGPVGLQGVPGVAGAQGPIGPQGIQGIEGQIGLQGPTGATGSAVLNGPTGPTAGNGNPGDFWLDTSNKILYGPKSTNAWPDSGVLLVGATGATGSKGETGAPGANGSMGTQGPAGTNGTNGADGLTTSVNGVPHVGGEITLTKANFSDLNHVDNTSDLNKPISNATQTALDAKAPRDSPILREHLSRLQ